MPTSRSGPRHGGTETVLARVVARILALAEQEGVNRQTLIEGAGLGGIDFDSPDSRVPASNHAALWRMIANGVHDPGFGVRAGASIQVRNLGLLGYAMCYSATLGAALRRLARYGRLVTGDLDWELEAPARSRVAVVGRHRTLATWLPYAVDMRLAGVLGISRQLTRAEVVPAEVAFAYAQPSSTLEHRRFFRCPLQFSQPDSKLVLLERDLDLPIPRADETLAGYLSEYAEQVLRQWVTGASTVERVRTAIWAGLSEGRPTLRHIATALQLPPRTLQRRLAEEGTSLHAEIEHVRKAMATATLRDRALPVEEVAFVLGYTEPSTFYRSFRRWTGSTPRRYRAALAETEKRPH